MSYNPEAYQTSPEQKKSRLDKISLKKLGTLALSLGLSIALSVGATMEANNRNAKKNINQLSYDTNEATDSKSTNFDISAGLYDTVPGDLNISLPGAEFSRTDTEIRDLGATTSTETVVKTYQESANVEENVQLMEWAALFEEDPMATEPRGLDVIKDTAEQTKQLIEAGWNIDNISIQGFASDEAISLHKNGNEGFGELDEKNILLANKRADAVSKLLKEQLENSLSDDSAKELESKIVIEGGVEVYDIQLASDIQKVADSLGMEVVDVISQYNHDPTSLSAENQNVLNGLRDDRYVSIKMTISRDVVTEENINKEVNTKQEIKTKKSIVIIPILIPILTRKKRDNIEPGTEPKPEPDTEPIPKVGSEPITVPAYEQPKLVVKPYVEKYKESAGEKFDRIKNIGKERSQYNNNDAYHRKQPRPYNNAQGNQHVMGQRGNRMARSHGGNIR